VGDAEAVRTYLQLSRLLDDIEPTHPEVSASLRLTLVRSQRRYRDGWLDADRFREVLLELTALSAYADPAESAPGLPASA
jgi:hypothetical protein